MFIILWIWYFYLGQLYKAIGVFNLGPWKSDEMVLINQHQVPETQSSR